MKLQHSIILRGPSHMRMSTTRMSTPAQQKKKWDSAATDRRQQQQHTTHFNTRNTHMPRPRLASILLGPHSEACLLDRRSHCPLFRDLLPREITHTHTLPDRESHTRARGGLQRTLTCSFTRRSELREREMSLDMHGTRKPGITASCWGVGAKKGNAHV